MKSSSKYSLTDKVAVISGATGFIGKAIVEELSELGAKIIILYNKNEEQARQQKEKIISAGGFCELLKVDITQSTDIDAAKQTILKTCRTIDILIICSGLKNRGSALLMNHNVIRDLVMVNVEGVINLSKAFLRPMIAKNKGRVILVGSHAGVFGMPGQAVYAATKGALSAFASSLAGEVGNKGITVNVVAPGALEDPSDTLYSEEEQRDICKKIGAGRLGRAEEVASSIGFLSSDAASYINGTTILVDGGARF